MFRSGASGGYTIVETMIFLVVTAALFGSAMVAVGGRQASVQFTQGIRDAQSSIQSIINDVATGSYPTNGDFTCTVAPVNNPASRPTFDDDSSPQGSSNQCIFLGKAVHFTDNGAPAGSGAVRYNVISIAARRLNIKDQEVQNLNEARPTALAPTVIGGMSGISSKVDKREFQFGIKVTRITDPAVASSKYSSIAFISSLPKFAGATNNLASGKQRVSFIAMTSGGPLTDDVYAAANTINALDDTALVNPQKGIVICLSDQGGGRRAMITVGEGAGQANAKLDIGSYDKVLCEG